MENGSRSSWAPIFLSILRIVVALLFIEHGTQKFFAFPSEASGGIPAMMSLRWWQGIIELVGGGLLLIGLLTRPVAFILAGDMAVAYWWFHAKIGQPEIPVANKIYPVLNNGDAAILFCFVFLYIAFAGGGPLGIDGSSKEA
ncbi:MAG TPA: DoxX family protein [Hyphomicrobiales bacterium]|nr:DoxX family protein [Hyphomicrobiales bacterium]